MSGPFQQMDPDELKHQMRSAFKQRNIEVLVRDEEGPVIFQHVIRVSENDTYLNLTRMMPEGVVETYIPLENIVYWQEAA